MKEKLTSQVTGITYEVADVVRIVNYMQAIFYMNHGVKLLDIYPSVDFKSNKPLFVYIFNRKESYQAYDAWCNNKQKASE